MSRRTKTSTGPRLATVSVVEWGARQLYYRATVGHNLGQRAVSIEDFLGLAALLKRAGVRRVKALAEPRQYHGGTHLQCLPAVDLAKLQLIVGGGGL